MVIMAKPIDNTWRSFAGFCALSLINRTDKTSYHCVDDLTSDVLNDWSKNQKLNFHLGLTIHILFTISTKVPILFGTSRVGGDVAPFNDEMTEPVDRAKKKMVASAFNFGGPAEILRAQQKDEELCEQIHSQLSELILKLKGRRKTDSEVPNWSDPNLL